MVTPVIDVATSFVGCIKIQLLVAVVWGVCDAGTNKFLFCITPVCRFEFGAIFTTILQQCVEWFLCSLDVAVAGVINQIEKRSSGQDEVNISGRAYIP